MTPEQMLREFHQSKVIHGGLAPGWPTADVPADVRDLRIDLLAEEVEELRQAMLAGDIVQIADGIADVVFVAVGTSVPYGIPFDAVFAEVFSSNMTKVNHTPKAKLTKGPGYEPPDIETILKQARLSAHKCEFPVQPPEGSLTSPGDCRECGKPFVIHMHELDVTVSLDKLAAARARLAANSEAVPVNG